MGVGEYEWLVAQVRAEKRNLRARHNFLKRGRWRYRYVSIQGFMEGTSTNSLGPRSPCATSCSTYDGYWVVVSFGRAPSLPFWYWCVFILATSQHGYASTYIALIFSSGQIRAGFYSASHVVYAGRLILLFPARDIEKESFAFVKHQPHLTRWGVPNFWSILARER